MPRMPRAFASCATSMSSMLRPKTSGCECTWKSMTPAAGLTFGGGGGKPAWPNACVALSANAMSSALRMVPPPGGSGSLALAREPCQRFCVIGGFDLRSEERELLHRPRLRQRVVAALLHKALELCDLAQLLELGRHIARVLEDAIREAHVLGYQAVVVELERTPGTGQVVELAAREGFLDLALSQIEQRHH